MTAQSTPCQTDEYWMALAIKLAKKGLFTTSPNPRVGCVIVANNACVGEGYHVQAGSPHAEVNALASAGIAAQGATAYVTLEPCSHTGRTPPCADALIRAGVARVVIGMTDPNPVVKGNGIGKLTVAGIVVTTGVREADARALNPGFIKRMETGLPWVRVKLGASIDGKIALRNKASKWITGSEARHDVQRLRAMSCAIVTGSGTVLADDPSLLVRADTALLDGYPLAEIRQPVRVVLDSQQQLSPHYAMFNDGHPVWLVNQRSEQPFSASVAQMHIELNAHNKIDLLTLLKQLAAKGINEVLVEAGAGLCGAFLSQGLVDELIVYQAPKLLGEKGVSMVNLPDYSSLNDVPQLHLVDVSPIAEDIRLTFRFTKNAC